MPKIPRDISGEHLVSLLKRLGYGITRQTRSHIRISSNYMGTEHRITIPKHDPIKIGTINNILKDISLYLKITKEELIKRLFDK